jgi:hypothetical protein
LPWCTKPCGSRFPRAQRTRLHRRIGTALAHRHRANPDPYLSQIATQLTQPIERF